MPLDERAVHLPEHDIIRPAPSGAPRGSRGNNPRLLTRRPSRLLRAARSAPRARLEKKIKITIKIDLLCFTGINWKIVSTYEPKIMLANSPVDAEIGATDRDATDPPVRC